MGIALKKEYTSYKDIIYRLFRGCYDVETRESAAVRLCKTRMILIMESLREIAINAIVVKVLKITT